MITLVLGHLRNAEFLRDLWSYVLQRRAFAWGKAVNPSDKSLSIDRARLVAMGAMLEVEGSMSSAAVVTSSSKTSRRTVYETIMPRRVQLAWLVVLALPPALYFVVGDFPSTARLQAAFATLIVVYTLLCLLIACMIWQILVVIGQAWSLSYAQHNGSSQGLLLHGLFLSTAVGGLLFSIISLMAWRNHGAFQQIGLYLDQSANYALSNPVTSSEMAASLGALEWFMLTMGTPKETAVESIIEKIISVVQGAPALIDFSSILRPKNISAEQSGNTMIETHQGKDLLDDIDRINKLNK